MATHGTDLSADLKYSCCGFQKLEYIVNKSLCMLMDFMDFGDLETEIVIRY